MLLKPFSHALCERCGLAGALLIVLLLGALPAAATMPGSSGRIPAALSEDFEAGLFSLPGRPPAAAVSSTQSVWYLPVILIGFSDAPLLHTAAEFNFALFDTTASTEYGSVFDYYTWASTGRLRVTGKVVATVNLSRKRSDYAYGDFGLTMGSTPDNIYGMIRDALIACQGGIDWSQFDQDHDGQVDMLWVVHQGVGGERSPDSTEIWSITSRLSGGWRFGETFETSQLLPGSTSHHYTIDRFSTLPELSSISSGHLSEIGVYCHEFGHALGLPDLYDASTIPEPFTNSGPGNWSIMATGSYGGRGLTPERPAGLGAWCEEFLGWAQLERPETDTVLTLTPVHQGGPVIDLWSQGISNPEHFLIENRGLDGYDATLPNHGLLVYHVDEGLMSARLAANRVNSGPNPAMVIEEGDGDFDLFTGANRGDASDPFPGASLRTALTDETSPNLRSFRDDYTDLALGNIQYLGSDVRFRVQVLPPGWLPPEFVAPPDQLQIDSPRPARWAVTDHEHRIFAVRSVLVSGTPQIALYSRLGDSWLPTEIISNSSRGALDPAITLLPGGDLAVVWTDSRGGRSQIFYRARIRGMWSSEGAISGISGDSHHAAVGADDRGMVETAWLNELGGTRQMMFKRFAYLSPFGTPSPVTFAGEEPDPPSLSVLANGTAFLVWPDGSSGSARLYFARYSPDSGMSSKLPLTRLSDGSQLTVSCALDTAGTLHTVWQVGGGPLNELHYQRRPKSTPPAPADTTIETAGNLLQHPAVACDDSLGVHVVYEDWGETLPRARYKLRSPTRGWEVVSTDLTVPDEGAIQPIPLPQSPYNVTNLFVSQNFTDSRLAEHRRLLGTLGTSSVPPPVAGAALRLGPNPLPPGASLSLSGEATTASPWVDVFDIAGRRVATTATRVSGKQFSARFESDLTSTWSAGVYFVTLRGSRQSARFVVLR